MQIKNIAKELTITILLVVSVFLFITISVQNTVVVGNSMNPTISDTQHIFVNKMVYIRFSRNIVRHFMPWVSDSPNPVTYPFHQPRRGEIIVFYPPGGGNVEYIKRVIAVPGDKIGLRRGKVVLNGVTLDEPYVQNSSPTTESRDIITVPVGNVFVMGDNRPHSEDSRVFGPVPQENIIGKAWVTYWPSSEWGFVRSTGLEKVFDAAEKARGAVANILDKQAAVAASAISILLKI